ncbi:hypothetical protein Bhyg_09642, partial [Pseudolycoriella hygida]
MNFEQHTRARILGLQKERLVELLENFFVRQVGRNYNVNGVEITKANWQSFADVLNSIGPPKYAHEWKTSFNTMKSRVRSKMLTVIESGGTTQVSLTAVDQKIYNMYPHNLNHLHVNNQDIVGVTSVTEPSLSEMPGNSLVSEEAIEHGDLPVNEEEQEDSAVNDAQSKALIDCLEQFVADSEVGSYIDDALWSVLESHLNTLGPSKDILEWKLHVNSLKLQIRRKAKQVLDNGGIPQHYLSDQEMRVYRMIPYLRFKHDSSTGSNCEDGDGFRMLNVVECTSSQMTGTAEPVASFIAATGEEVVSPMLQEAQIIDSPILDTADNDDFHFV